MRSYYREGLALSAAVHAGLVLAALVGLPHLGREIPDIPEVIPVEFVQIDEEIRSDEPAPPPDQQQEPAPRPAPAEQAPPPEIAEAVPPPEAVEEQPPEPDYRPEPPEPRLRVAPRAKPTPPSRFDPGRVAALIDRSIKEEAPATSRAPEREEESEEAPRQTALAARIATATLQAAIRQRVLQCWFVPAGAKELEEMRVRIRIQLREDGRLMRPPQFLDAPDMSAPGNEFFRIFAESARRAVLSCQPYDNLPLSQYDLWRQIDFTFDAGQMLGG